MWKGGSGAVKGRGSACGGGHFLCPLGEGAGDRRMRGGWGPSSVLLGKGVHLSHTTPRRPPAGSGWCGGRWNLVMVFARYWCSSFTHYPPQASCGIRVVLWKGGSGAVKGRGSACGGGHFLCPLGEGAGDRRMRGGWGPSSVLLGKGVHLSHTTPRRPPAGSGWCGGRWKLYAPFIHYPPQASCGIRVV